MIEYALKYAAIGWSVFPCHSVINGKCSCGKDDCTRKGKHPRTENGLKDSTTNFDKIKQWWGRWPDANIAINCGESRIAVIDVDSRKDGFASWEKLIEVHEELLEAPTPVSHTGGGGFHAVYSMNGETIRNSTGKIGRGIDSRGDGGYIIAPPSTHESGALYEWSDCDPFNCKPTIIPDVFVKLINEKEKQVAPPQSEPIAKEITDAYVRIALQRECAIISSAEEGTRHNCLISGSFSMGTLIGAGVLDQNIAKAELTRAALIASANGSTQLSQYEIDKTIDDGLARGLLHPRDLKKQPIVDFEEEKAKHESSGKKYYRSDLGNAHRLFDRYGHNIKFCHAWNKWLIWNMARWRIDESDEIFRMSENVIVDYHESSLSQIANTEEKKFNVIHSLRSQNRKEMNDMIKMTATLKGISINPDSLDSDKMKLNTANGTIDLRTGILHPFRKEDLNTKACNAAYNQNAECPSWLLFLDKIFLGNADLIEFIQRVVGYTLTGRTDERKIFILYGSGQNGKSVLLDTIAWIMGDYAMRTPTETLMVKQQSGIPNDIARLKGARFVHCSETEEGRRMAESLVKDITGGDIISARFMRGEWFDFRPEFKIMLGTNHRPKINGVDQAIWDRIREIPFEYRIKEEEKIPRSELMSVFQEESEGILNWMVKGCLKWQESGLTYPDAVARATNNYKVEMDYLKDYIDERIAEDPLGQLSVKDAFSDYSEWCQKNGETAMKKRTFTSKMSDKGYPTVKKSGTRYFPGIKLSDDNTIFDN